MRTNLKKTLRPLSAVLALLLITALAQAQDRTRTKRLHSPASVRGFIGGESHDSYVIRCRRGATMRVRISWKPEAGNTASFTIRESPDVSSEPVSFGKEYEDGKRWVGKIPKTRDYYIDVIANPAAHYRLEVKVN